MSATTHEPARRDPRYHADHLDEVAQARRELDEARSIVAHRTELLGEAVGRALDDEVPPTYIARAAKWSRTQVYRVRDQRRRRR